MVAKPLLLLSRILPYRALEGVEVQDVFDEEAIHHDDEEEAGDEEEPKVTNPDLGFCLWGQKWLSFLVHLVWNLLLKFQKF